MAAELSKTAAVNAAKKEAEIKTGEAVRKAEELAKENFNKACIDEAGIIPEEVFKNVLKSILDTMDAAGCTVCAAKMLVKKEMKKYGR